MQTLHLLPHTHTTIHTSTHTTNKHTHTLLLLYNWLGCCFYNSCPLLQYLQYNCIFCINIYIVYIQQSPNQSCDYLPKTQTHSNDNKLNLKQLQQVPNPAVLIVSMKRKLLCQTESNRIQNNQRLTNCSFFLFTLFCFHLFYQFVVI